MPDLHGSDAPLVDHDDVLQAPGAFLVIPVLNAGIFRNTVDPERLFTAFLVLRFTTGPDELAG